jgi:hypothetical protein
MTDDVALRRAMNAIAADDGAALHEAMAAAPLATAALPHGATRKAATGTFLTGIAHHIHAGDTVLHVAVAAQQAEIIRLLKRHSIAR